MRKLSKLDYRIPNWDAKSLFDRVCPICNKKGESVFMRPDNLIVNKCSCCGTYYVSPAPDNDSLNKFYSTYSDNYSRMPNLTPEQLKQDYDKINPLADIRIRKLSSILEIENSTILDIGFGQPFLLYLLVKLGAQTHGIEIVPRAIKYAEYLTINSIFKGDFSQYNTEIKYDAVIMTDFVEHPLLPLNYIEKAVSLLKQTGIILIWTPNGDAEVRSENPITFRVDLEHLQYFTPQTVAYLAKKLNMDILHLETLGKPALTNIENEIGYYTRNSRPELNANLKRMIKVAIRKYVLHENFETNNIPIEIGNYHLFAVLAKS